MNCEIILGKKTKISIVIVGIVLLGYIVLIWVNTEPIWLDIIYTVLVVGSLAFMGYAKELDKEDYYRPLYLSKIKDTIENSIQARFPGKYFHNSGLQKINIEGLRYENGDTFVKFYTDSNLAKLCKKDYVKLEDIPFEILEEIQDKI